MVSVYVSSVERLVGTLAPGLWPAGIGLSRKARIQQLTRKDDRQRTLAAEILLRRVLSAHTGISDKKIIIRRDKFQKPFLPNSRLCFSLSHSANRVACALDSSPLGVDLEKIEPFSELEGIADQCFSVSERSMIQSCPAYDQLKRFYELWTLKESFVKAVGKGLSIPLDSFSIRIRDDGTAFLENEPNAGWFLRVYSFEADYRLAVCASTSDLPRDESQFMRFPSETRALQEPWTGK